MCVLKAKKKKKKKKCICQRVKLQLLPWSQILRENQNLGKRNNCKENASRSFTRGRNKEAKTKHYEECTGLLFYTVLGQKVSILHGGSGISYYRPQHATKISLKRRDGNACFWEPNELSLDSGYLRSTACMSEVHADLVFSFQLLLACKGCRSPTEFRAT